MAHYNLGKALRAKGRLDEAIAHYRRALQIDPKYAEAYCNLGFCLREQGRLAESLAAYRHGHELGSQQPGWRYPSAEWLRQAERLVELDAKLPAILEGKPQPADSQDWLTLALACHYKQRYLAAARLRAEAFAAEPKLANDLKTGHRYHAACYAAPAGSGQGEDAQHLDEKERSRWRKQGLDWLRADLALWAGQLKTGKPEVRREVQQKLRHWQQDKDLTSLRDPDAISKLPAEGQQMCKQLWAEVSTVLKRAQWND